MPKDHANEEASSVEHLGRKGRVRKDAPAQPPNVKSTFLPIQKTLSFDTTRASNLRHCARTELVGLHGQLKFE